MRHGWRVFEIGNSNEMLCNRGMRQGGSHIGKRRLEGPGVERRQHESAREIVASVDNVRSRGTGRQGALMNGVQLAALAEIDCDRHNLCGVCARQPLDGCNTRCAPRTAKHDSLHQPFTNSINFDSMFRA